MAPVSELTKSHGTQCASDEYGSKITKMDAGINEDILPKIQGFTTNNKIDFLHYIGLGISNNCHSAQNSDQIETCDVAPEASCKLLNSGSNSVFSPAPQKENRAKSNKKNCRDRVGAENPFKLLRPCRVLIIGTKCRVCGKTFKCVTDLRAHMKKRHRKKTPKVKLVLKIGNEVISEVTIKKKHLREAQQEDILAINNRNAALRLSSETPLQDRMNDLEEVAPLIDLCENGIDGNEDVRLSPLGYGNPLDFLSDFECRQDKDEDVTEVLRICRPQKWPSAINHESPNRAERELLLSDAILEFDRLDNSKMNGIEHIKGAHSGEGHHKISGENCWLPNANSSNAQFDRINNNCASPMESNLEVASPLKDGSYSYNSDLGFDMNYFNDVNDENTCMYPSAYRKSNGDVVPDFVDYTETMRYLRAPLHNSQNERHDINALESPFYNETRINDWDRMPCNSDHKVPPKKVELSPIVKEEIMLDDVF